MRITYSGNDQVFVVPNSITRIHIKAWGGGGGGGDRGGAFQFGTGGGGGFASGALNVASGQAIGIIVGQGGIQRSSAPTYGGGGPGGINLGDFRLGASGGGRSAIRIGGVELLTAAGGGGSASASTIRVAAGAGGQNAITGNGCVIPAQAGSTTAGGTRAQMAAGQTGELGTDGIAFAGGSGGRSPTGNSGGGGGGGAGYFGGGGGAGQTNPATCQDSSGAGGSNFADATISAAVLSAGNLETVAAAGDVHHAAGIGAGAVGLAQGGNGEVVIQWLVTADLSVSKTNTPNAGANDQAGDTVVRGQSTTYSIVVSNAGPNDATNAVLTDPAQANLNCTQVTCTAHGAAVCPASPTIAALQSASGLVLPSIPSGDWLTFLVTCQVN